MKRLFLALPIPEKIAVLVTPLQKDIKGARFSPRANLHITLRFIGDLEKCQIEVLANKFDAVKCANLNLELLGAGYFGGDAPHSAHLNIKANENLIKLAQQCETICREFGIAPETRQYHPHLTLAYLSKQTTNQDVEDFKMRNANFTAPIWCAKQFHLYASQLNDGPSVYNIEKTYNL